MLRFLSADKITDPESASRILSKYFNREAELALDAQSFNATLLSAKSNDGSLHIKFLWDTQDPQTVEHVRRYAESKLGNVVRFRCGSDELVGLLSGTTDLPSGATLERYIKVPFSLSFSFSSDDQRPEVDRSYSISGRANAYLQIGEHRIPVNAKRLRKSSLIFSLENPGDQDFLLRLSAGKKVMFSGPNVIQEMEVDRVSDNSDGTITLLYRGTFSRVFPEGNRKLVEAYVRVRAVGLSKLAKRLGKFLDFSDEEMGSAEEEEEPDDKEGMGPGAPGTDSHIVTYVKAPQTQGTVDGPINSRGMPLHERLS